MKDLRIDWLMTWMMEKGDVGEDSREGGWV